MRPHPLELVYDSTQPPAPFTPDTFSHVTWLKDSCFFLLLRHKNSQKLSAKFLVPLFGFKINHVYKDYKCNTASVGSSYKGA